MARKLALILILAICICTAIVTAEDPATNEATPVVTDTPLVVTPTPTPTETVIEPTPTPTPDIPPEEKVTEDLFGLNEDSKSEVIIKDPPATLTITPYLSTGVKLAEPVDIKELPLDRAVTSKVDSLRMGVLKTKIVQIYPESRLEVSVDAETIIQKKNITVISKYPDMELYYGYQNSSVKPWKYYYKVETCSGGTCRVVRGEFDTRKVWIEYQPESAVNAITIDTKYEALP